MEPDKLNIYQKLSMVQTELKAPKGQYNSFGKYAYRSCEDILEALKPLLAKNKLTLHISDSVKEIGGKLFVEAEVCLYDVESDNSSIVVYGLAGHELDKKGMDFSQITGAASSYARKYALNGLFLIDDTKDADATNEHGNGENYGKSTTRKPKAAKQAEVKQDDEVAAAKQRLVNAITAWCNMHGSDVKKAMGGIAKRPDYEQTAEFYNKAAAEFENAVKKEVQ